MCRTWLRCRTRGEVVEPACAGHHAMAETPLQLIRTVEDFLRAGAHG